VSSARCEGTILATLFTRENYMRYLWLRVQLPRIIYKSLSVKVNSPGRNNEEVKRKFTGRRDGEEEAAGRRGGVSLSRATNVVWRQDDAQLDTRVAGKSSVSGWCTESLVFILVEKVGAQICQRDETNKPPGGATAEPPLETARPQESGQERLSRARASFLYPEERQITWLRPSFSCFPTPSRICNSAYCIYDCQDHSFLLW
jgi:hypothetical protein